MTKTNALFSSIHFPLFINNFSLVILFISLTKQVYQQNMLYCISPNFPKIHIRCGRLFFSTQRRKEQDCKREVTRWGEGADARSDVVEWYWAYPGLRPYVEDSKFQRYFPSTNGRYSHSVVQTQHRFRSNFSISAIFSTYIVSVSSFFGFFGNEARSIRNFRNRFHL